jgi:putative IMPACT (imprinted ancient) family translation regulator
MLAVVLGSGIGDVAVVVTRYFGGTKLGTGGLVRAYSETAVKGVEAATVAERLLYQELNMAVDYHWLSIVKREAENAGGQKISMEFDQQVGFKVCLRPDAVEALSKMLTEITAGQVIIKAGDFTYI